MNRLIAKLSIALLLTISIGAGCWLTVGDFFYELSAQDKESSEQLFEIVQKIESGEITLTKDKVIFTLTNLAESNKGMSQASLKFHEEFEHYLGFITGIVLIQAALFISIFRSRYNKNGHASPSGRTAAAQPPMP
ncbi:hypothetical protein NO559_16280 [Dasania sp. GY-MA-18]|uniref:Uncharacterized protein n=1 Tax=Dasania phycosphaerae TaxID=2950436 RepID=A0A9J6RRJ9_9GAMM|nr:MULTISPECIES: hypothetical protein [Dasania]MCR8924333.1 hypothetical protein [Dasania sp. GY-MA-18]MCZ0866986.1 hypothetical protein [Dasania phycosphaerae]MCZ0870490.1 hypothetical protein [Dasania phycosphaerae]